MVTKVTTRTQELQKRSQAHGFNTYGGVVGIQPEKIWEKGRGIRLTDTDGKEYIDLSSFFLCANLGYCRKELVDVAYEQMQKLTYAISFANSNNIPAIEYAEALAKFTPENINHFYFCNSGSEANESAIKIAKAYWHAQGKASKYKILSLMEGFHGLAGFVTGFLPEGDLRPFFGPEAPGIIRVPNYNCYRCPLSLTYPGCDITCAKYLERVIGEEGENTIAAFIAEPEQGYGGGIAPPPEYFPMVRDICTRHNVLFISDEVITGFCRTGRNFGVDNWNVKPDMMAMAKGMAGVHFPVAGIGISDKVYAGLANTLIMTGHTTGGHPVAMAVGKAALDIYIKERMCEHVTKLGNHIKERFEKEFLPLPNIGYAGGLGLFHTIEVVADKETKRRFPLEMDIMHTVVLPKCMERGLFVRVFSTTRHDRIAISPPLMITQEEIDTALDILYPILAGLKDIKVK